MTARGGPSELAVERAALVTQVGWSSYRIVGSTMDDLRRAIALLGPRRDGCAFGGATEWRVEWSFRADVCDLGDPTFALRSLVVRASVVVRLPEGRPAARAASEVVEAFTRYRAALTAHERGHVALALRAGRAVRDALASTPVQSSVRGFEYSPRR